MKLRIMILLVPMLWIGGCGSNDAENLDPNQAVQLFLTAEVAEDQLMDPLILAGKDAVPLVIKKLRYKDMSRRRYAIGALGNIGDKASIPILIQILEDDTEADYYRCDALNAIGMIDFELARQRVKKGLDDSVICLSVLGKTLLTVNKEQWIKTNYMRRSISQARAGTHE